MGCLFILNDSESNIFWKKKIYIMEIIIIFESLALLILSFIALLTFPFDSIKLVKQKFLLETIIYYIFSFSMISLFISLLIKYIHLENKIRPNYRLCLMNFCAYIGFFLFFLSGVLSFYITLVIIEWEDITGIIAYRILSSTQKKIVISLGKAIYTLIWNNFIICSAIFGIVDFGMEILIISKASKYLSEGNNINNSNLLFELFKKPIENNLNKNNINKNNILDNYINNNNIKKENSFKLRFIISDNNNNINNFENKNNKFREVEIIQKIEYNSVGVQTEIVDNNNIYNNDFNDNNNKLIDDDYSNNFILLKNKSLIDSKSTFNDILNQPIK